MAERQEEKILQEIIGYRGYRGWWARVGSGGLAGACLFAWD